MKSDNVGCEERVLGLLGLKGTVEVGLAVVPALAERPGGAMVWCSDGGLGKFDGGEGVQLVG